MFYELLILNLAFLPTIQQNKNSPPIPAE